VGQGLDPDVVQKVRELDRQQGMSSHQAVAVQTELSVEQLIERRQKIKRVMDEEMNEGEHYGKVGGVTKPTLLKPGAEVLCSTFMLDPEYEYEKEWDGDHLTVTVVCTLYSVATGQRWGSGLAMCSTKESNYAYRKAQLKCPDCGVEAVVRRKAEKSGPMDRYICIGNEKGGCWHKFAEDDARITSQKTGQVPNPNLPDEWNTVIKMSAKRGHVAATLTVTGASDVFTQDVEDRRDEGSGEGESASTDPRPAESGRAPAPAAAGGQPSPEDAASATEKRMKIEKNMNDLMAALKEADASVDWMATLKKKSIELHETDTFSDLNLAQLGTLEAAMEKWLAVAVPA
jgi:hypothetical protein